VRGRPSGIGASPTDHGLAGHPGPGDQAEVGPASVDPARTSAVPLVAQVAVRYPLVDLAVVQPSIEEVIAAVRGAPYRRPANCVFGCVGV
jgi:hypothetical protein